jgi:hypothetical protein
MPYNIWCGGCGNHIGMGKSRDMKIAVEMLVLKKNMK